jgi:hypothetical protein
MSRPPHILSTLAILAALAAGSFTALAAQAGEDSGGWFENLGGARIKGSGQATSQVRQVSGFNAIRVKGSIRLVVRQAGKESVELRADDNILPYIETTIVERSGVQTLEIGMKRNLSYSSRTPLVATVDVTNLKGLSLSGSGDAVASGLKTSQLQAEISGSGRLKFDHLDADALSVQISGSGDVTANGRAGKLSIAISGSGNVETRSLESEDVHIDIAGGGDASVNARKTLRVAIAGSGDVDYTGDPTVRTSIAGSGNVRKH